MQLEAMKPTIHERETLFPELLGLIVGPAVQGKQTWHDQRKYGTTQ